MDAKKWRESVNAKAGALGWSTAKLARAADMNTNMLYDVLAGRRVATDGIRARIDKVLEEAAS